MRTQQRRRWTLQTLVVHLDPSALLSPTVPCLLLHRVPLSRNRSPATTNSALGCLHRCQLRCSPRPFPIDWRSPRCIHAIHSLSFHKFRGECTFSLGARNWPVVLLRYEQRWFTHMQAANQSQQPLCHPSRGRRRAPPSSFFYFQDLCNCADSSMSRFVASARGFEGSSPSALIRLPFYCCMPHSRLGAAAFNRAQCVLVGGAVWVAAHSDRARPKTEQVRVAAWEFGRMLSGGASV
jgi:hypothetical protein